VEGGPNDLFPIPIDRAMPRHLQSKQNQCLERGELFPLLAVKDYQRHQLPPPQSLQALPPDRRRNPPAKSEVAQASKATLINADFFISYAFRRFAYWLVIAGGLVSALLVIAGALVISTPGLLLTMSLVDELLALLELVDGSLDAELVELD
jgi:hypothetical protein